MNKFNYTDFIKILFKNNTFAGTLTIPQTMVNRDLKGFVLDKFNKSLRNYKISFENGFIYMQILAELNHIGKIQGNYKIKVDSFIFKNGQHKIKLSYSEDLQSKGNLMQSMALKAAGVNGSYLKTAYEFALNRQTSPRPSTFLSSLKITNNTITINLDSIGGFQEMFDNFELTLKSCDNGTLKLQV